MDVKFLALLFLSLSDKVLGSKDDHHCSKTAILSNCVLNSRIQVSKTNEHYQLRICFNNKCISGKKNKEYLDWIKCDEICDFCNLLHPQTNLCREGHDCEQQVDLFLNKVCKTATLPQLPGREINTTVDCVEQAPAVKTTTITQINNVSMIRQTLARLTRASTVTVTVPLSSMFTTSIQILATTAVSPVRLVDTSISTTTEKVTITPCITTTKEMACSLPSTTCTCNNMTRPSCSLKTSTSPSSVVANSSCPSAAVTVSLSVSTTTMTVPNPQVSTTTITNCPSHSTTRVASVAPSQPVAVAQNKATVSDTSKNGQSFSRLACSATPNTVLGALLGVSMLLHLVMVGWVLTRLIKKKQEAKKTFKPNVNSTVTVHTNSSNDQEFEEKCFDNPTYGDTVTTEPNTTSQNGSHELEKNLQVTYDVINLPTNTTAVEDGQAYDVLNRGQAKSGGSERLYDKNYSKLSSHQDS